MIRSIDWSINIPRKACSKTRRNVHIETRGPKRETITKTERCLVPFPKHSMYDIHVYLHWGGFRGRCRRILHTWSVWVWYLQKSSLMTQDGLIILYIPSYLPYNISFWDCSQFSGRWTWELAFAHQEGQLGTETGAGFEKQWVIPQVCMEHVATWCGHLKDR